MAKVVLQKVLVTGFRTHYKILMQELHRSGLLEIVDTSDLNTGEVETEEHFGVYDLARIDGVIKFLKPYETMKTQADSMLSGGKLVMSEEDAKARVKAFSVKSDEIFQEAEEAEENLVRYKNEVVKIRKKREELEPFKLFKMSIEVDYSTETTKSWVGSVAKAQQKTLMEELLGESNLIDMDIFAEENGKVYFRVTADNSVESLVSEILTRMRFEEFDFSVEFADAYGKKPREVLYTFEKEEKEFVEKREKLETRVKELAENLDDLRILCDYNTWGKTKNDIQHKMLKTKNLFAFEAWMPKKSFDSFTVWLQNAFAGEVSIEKIEAKENEEEPVLVKNRRGIASFEPITEMFALPGAKDIDPTVYLAPFFFVFFGLCLSDVGYGMILTLVSAYFLLLGKFSRTAKDGLFLLFLCGVGATLGGIFLGGYFGMTPEQAPSFLLNPDFVAGIEGVNPFRGQFIDPMVGQGPILFLGLAMGLGMIQLLTGVFLDFYRQMKNGDYVDAICDPLAWFFLLLMIVFYVAADFVGFLDKGLMTTLVLVAAGILVLTQGRKQKIWLLKPLSGILGLYNITGYVSDLLSYSRIMALGLATGVIGFAMNLTAGILSSMMPHPAIGVVVAIIVIVFGHSLNFALSLLGAFVHSGRLQFIEFFGKFYEGGGRKFKPFVREKKYLFFRN
jgi:V/A-type H+/Na+-transporting ATPase subunit I